MEPGDDDLKFFNMFTALIILGVLYLRGDFQFNGILDDTFQSSRDLVERIFGSRNDVPIQEAPDENDESEPEVDENEAVSEEGLVRASNSSFTQVHIHAMIVPKPIGNQIFPPLTKPNLSPRQVSLHMHLPITSNRERIVTILANDILVQHCIENPQELEFKEEAQIMLQDLICIADVYILCQVENQDMHDLYKSFFIKKNVVMECRDAFQARVHGRIAKHVCVQATSLALGYNFVVESTLFEYNSRPNCYGKTTATDYARRR